jgi:murein DD-endopeptidase MepM/ murein hydrolase activator NlpD
VARAQDAIETSASALDDVRAEVAALESVVDELRGDAVSVVDETVRVQADERTRRAALQSRLETATQAVPLAIRKLTTLPFVTIDDLSRPLEAVSRAIHASDELAVLAVDEQRALRRAWALATGISARVRQAGSRAAVLTPALTAQVASLTRARHEVRGVEDPGRVFARADTLRADALRLLQRVQLIQSRLREVGATVLGRSVSLQDDRATARREIGEVRHVLDQLYARMFTAQAVVSDLLPTWSSVFDGADAPGPIGDGPLYVCPVDPPRSYSDDFGAPRYTGGYHPHAGNDIFAPAGTPIRAPFDGVAVDASNGLGGNAVTVYGEDGYAYNAHLQSFGALGDVEAGTVIGYVGNSGNAVNTPSHDHFEWHPENRAAVNPFPFLNEVCLP